MYEDLKLEYVTGKDYFDLSKTNPALVIIDMQRGFVEEGAIFECPGGREIVPTINRLVHTARETGVPVVWVQWEATPPLGLLDRRKNPPLKEGRTFHKDSREFELYPNLTAPIEGDLRIIKHTFGAFSQTNLDTMLRNLGVDAAIVTGVATDVCCESTVVGGFELGYLVALVSDANAGMTYDAHDAALKKMEACYARVLSASQAEEELRQRAGKAPVLAASADTSKK